MTRFTSLTQSCGKPWQNLTCGLRELVRKKAFWPRTFAALLHHPRKWLIKMDVTFNKCSPWILISFFWSEKKREPFFQRFFCGLPLHYLSKSRDVLAERIKIFSNFLRIKNWQNFAFFIFWRQSHQSHIVLPPPLITTYINHKPISLLEKKNNSNKKHLT